MTRTHSSSASSASFTDPFRSRVHFAVVPSHPPVVEDLRVLHALVRGTWDNLRVFGVAYSSWRKRGTMNGETACSGRPIWSGLAALIASAVLLAACSASSGTTATSVTTHAAAPHAASSSTTLPTSSPTQPTIAAVERAACPALGAQDAQGDRCAFQSMHVSTVSPEWVFVQGLGLYSGTDEPPSVQEARSDLDELILNLRTDLLIGPTNVGFCHVAGTNVSGPDLSAVPSSVLAGWGLQPCDAGTSTSVTAAVPSSAPPSTAPSSSSTSTAVASQFTVWSGSWGAHEQQLEVGPTGTGHLTYADLRACPSCSLGGAPRGTMDFELTSVTGGAANGAVTASSDPQNYTVGQVVTVSLTAGAPGQLLELSVGGQGPVSYCNSTSAGQCGA